jgi:uncharacterized repeat protein (TIGR03803 family)
MIRRAWRELDKDNMIQPTMRRNFMNMTIEKAKIGGRSRRRAPGLLTTLLGLACLAAMSVAASAQTTEVVLHVFCSLADCADGASPTSGVILDSAGNLYGGAMVVYELAPSWQETVLSSFCPGYDCANGASPEVSARDSEGNLYGAAGFGGAHLDGVVYKLTASGQETVLYSFCSLANCADGSAPAAGPILDSEGNLYGTVSQGGAHENAGVVYKVTPFGHETVLYNFCSLANCADGGTPLAGLTFDSEGNLYGVTSAGGAHSAGVVYKLTPSGQITVLYTFCSLANCADGSDPVGSLIFDSEGNLYGATNVGGAHGAGVVYELSASGSETVLYDFCSLEDCADGSGPRSGVISDSDGNLYGTTQYGGENVTSNKPKKTGNGLVYKVGTSGNETVLYSFGGAVSGASGLVRDSAGNLYGTTEYGGGHGDGIVFKLEQ